MGGESFEPTLAAAKAGAEWAWNSLYRELAGPVTGYLANRGASEPEDLTSEVFLAVAKGIHGFQGDLASFRSWVFVIAHRRLIDSRRARSRRPGGASDPIPDVAGGDVETEAMESLTEEGLRRIFEHLTPPQQDVLALRIIAGLTLEETAKVMGRKVGAVKALQRRGIDTLRNLFEKERVTI